MRKNIYEGAFAIGMIILIVGVSFSPSTISIESQENLGILSIQKEWHVDDDGDGNFTSIQEAIDNASIDDKIIVYSGCYNEHIRITKSIQLFGRDHELGNGSSTGKPIIDGNYLDDVVVIGPLEPGGILQDNIKISGFEIRNSGKTYDAGIFVHEASKIEISGNVIHSNCRGIYLYQCDEVRLYGNIVSENDFGICLELARIGEIQNNVVENNNLFGIWLDLSSESDVRYNVIRNNSIGLMVIRSSICEINHNDFIDNVQDAWFKNCYNTWRDNWWGQPKIIKIIPGGLKIQNVIKDIICPTFQIDLRPSKSRNCDGL